MLDRVLPQPARARHAAAHHDHLRWRARADQPRSKPCSPRPIRIRCWFHRLANIRAKLPDETAAEVLAHLYAVRDAPTLDAARAAADRFVNTYRREYPAAVGLLHR